MQRKCPPLLRSTKDLWDNICVALGSISENLSAIKVSGAKVACITCISSQNANTIINLRRRFGWR